MFLPCLLIHINTKTYDDIDFSILYTYYSILNEKKTIGSFSVQIFRHRLLFAICWCCCCNILMKKIDQIAQTVILFINIFNAVDIII